MPNSRNYGTFSFADLHVSWGENGLVWAACWCQRGCVLIPRTEVGRSTGSCDRPNCKAPR